MTREVYDVAIIGAGPAGLAAASELVSAGVHIVVLDEQQRPGGQILRQPPSGFNVTNWLKGPLYSGLKNLLFDMEQHPGVEWHFATTVSGITQSGPELFEVWHQGPEGLAGILARRVLVATGAYERPLAFPGSTVPGVMGAGAIQTLLKSQQVLGGDSFVFAGAHPLQLVVAEQVLAAGGHIEAVVFAQPFSRSLSILKSPFLPLMHGRTFMAALKSFRALRKAGVPVLFGQTVSRAYGVDALERIEVCPVTPDGRLKSEGAQHFTADTLGLCYGFQVSSELARQVGAETFWGGDTAGGWLVSHDRWGETSVVGLFAAGETTGMAGADAGVAEGHIAGIGLLRSLGKRDDRACNADARGHRKRLGHYQRFATYLRSFSELPEHLVAGMMTPESYICRCETVSCAELSTVLHENKHLADAGSIKLLSRVGMGRCQGRLCYANFADMVRSETGKTEADIGPFQARWPAKPLVIGDILADEENPGNN
ncbi:FAD-dependent oxidoreductase [Kordiimonas sp.]|uniref:FAD-dependent oxidoreductase n=1 Tax=Kordiimonas sp. TaxID=1970157 RepID=UPI003A913806